MLSRDRQKHQVKWFQLGTHDDGMLQNPAVARQLFVTVRLSGWVQLGFNWPD